MKEKIEQLAEKHLERIMEVRRELHRFPELGFKEFKTAEIIKKELDRIGIPYESEIAVTGIVGLIKGKKEGKTVLLRADIDALPIDEESRCEFKSEIEGNMHACGHDGHAAGLLGAAMILNELKDEIAGNIKLVFQPAEEGPGGADPMIKAGILENPKVDAAFGCHIWPAYKTGQILVKDGDMMSHTTSFDIMIQGVGGHGSQPEKTVDPIIIGSQIVTNFQNIISRNISTLKPAVLSCCSIKAGETYNVIPDKLTIKGTIRTFDEELTNEIVERMECIIKGITNSYGASYIFDVNRMYPAVKNNHEMFEFSKATLEKVVGEKNVIVMEEPLMGSEDFSYFGKKVPSNFFLVGVRDTQEDIESMLHHPKLLWNEKDLKISAKALSQLAVDFLNK
ncbi:M20 family metallopeptidase [Fusobacterium sp.]|uniref:M20 metallopeptidase family protein n=1 Tax=Fusobacterium sp. TaxID=68766 RepID=UPI0029047614|nr:M20 family metallopeptidase [Fusobacterium sp.]MDU1909765.1 M20 family metallopeptidase [Fusobacterium sp.]